MLPLNDMALIAIMKMIYSNLVNYDMVFINILFCAINNNNMAFN